MKVLFCVRHNFFQLRGGAYFQILKTKEYLEKSGIECQITDSLKNIDVDYFDIIHLTDLTWVYDNLMYLEKLVSFKGKKILSTIYWPFDDYASNGTPLIQKIVFKLFGLNGFEFVKALAKYFTRGNRIYLRGIKKSHIRNQIEIVNQIDWLLPNSQAEMDVLNKRLNLNKKNYTVVNNAIDLNIYDQVFQKNIKKQNDLIVFAGRIDPRKNQLNFLKAMMNTNFKIRFIGEAGKDFLSYFKKLKKLSGKRGNVKFISHISQKELFENMMEAKVSVLTSWIETPGLVSIEAAYAGCNLVVCDKGSVRDYFKDYAYYCSPDDLISIKNAISKAIKNDFNENLRSMVRRKYSYTKAAEQTIAGYKKCLGMHEN